MSFSKKLFSVMLLFCVGMSICMPAPDHSESGTSGGCERGNSVGSERDTSGGFSSSSSTTSPSSSDTSASDAPSDPGTGAN